MRDYKSKLTIIQRLDAIERERREELRSRFLRGNPELPESEIERLGDMLAATRIRLIAETALSLLPGERIDEVLGRFEPAGFADLPAASRA